mmetsp:Transcript_49890/g.124048  ORF Transcript_49890/g.124048 Transcript_49890/m.124048 type:complete len:104 (-) Transcript_49890:156-467(-)
MLPPPSCAPSLPAWAGGSAPFSGVVEPSSCSSTHSFTFDTTWLNAWRSGCTIPFSFGLQRCNIIVKSLLLDWPEQRSTGTGYPLRQYDGGSALFGVVAMCVAG